MQSDLEHGMPLTSAQNLYTVKHEVLPGGNEYSTHAAELVGKAQHSYIPADAGALEGITQGPQISERHGMRCRRNISTTMWLFALILGDEVLFFSLLALVLVLTPHLNLELRVSSYEISSWYLKILWGFLALISWRIAVKVTRAQELSIATDRLKGPLSTVCALVLMLICWMALTYPVIISGIVYSRAMLFFLLVAAPTLVAWRSVFATAIHLPRFRRQAVIIGLNTAGEAVAKELQRAKYPVANVLGYIRETTDEGPQDHTLPVLGDGSALHRLAEQGSIDVIIMAIDHKVNPELFQQAIEAAQQGISLVPMTIAYERSSGKIAVEYLGDQWYMALPLEIVISPLYLCWRQVMDFTFGLLGMVFLLLILPILALLIYLDAPGPIFYSQERLGHQGRKFYIHKFRSMYTNAERTGNAVWANASDARVTRVGRFMRATHLDELPQVLNILRGEMSLIGPRPERQEFVTELEKTIPFYRCRLMIKPGLTGWAQVKYRYGNSSQDALVKLQYDLYYIKHQSFMLDIFIILKTVAEVFLHRGT